MHRYGLHGNVLDVGGGNGAFWRFTADKFKVSVMIADVSPVAIEQTKGVVQRSVVADITDSKTLEGEEFDAVCCIEILEHIPADIAGLASCYRLLKPGGLLFLSVPHSMKYWTKNDDFSHHQRRYKINELKDKLHDSGFNILELFTWGSSFYKMYYFLKGNMDSQILFGSKPGLWKRLISEFLFQLFKLNDLSKGHQGVNLYCLAVKPY